MPTDKSLLTEEEGQALLGSVDSMDEDQLEELDEILTDYEESIDAIATRYEERMEPDLEKLEKSEDADDVAYAKSVREEIADLKSEE